MMADLVDCPACQGTGLDDHLRTVLGIGRKRVSREVADEWRRRHDEVA